MMRLGRFLIVLGIVFIILGLLGYCHAHAAHRVPKGPRREGPCVGIDRHGRVRTMKAIIRCAVREVGPVPGGVSEALHISYRESRWHPRATSWTGCCHGLFQQHEAYWSGRARHYLRKRWFGRAVPSVFNPRANALVSIKMARDGWCPDWC